MKLLHLTAGYTGKPVIKHLTLDIHPGEWIFLIGTSGSGKSTFLQTIFGNLKPLQVEIAPTLLRHEQDLSAILGSLKAEFPMLEDFEREFPSLCFALATGVGKTRLMGAFISYLHLAHGINNFFVLAPNLTIYNKLIADFTRNTPKYVFKGIAEFAQQSPLIITGDNYDQSGAVVDDQLRGFAHDVRINIFNISKINSEVRGGKEPRIKRMKGCWAIVTSIIWQICQTSCC